MIRGQVEVAMSGGADDLNELKQKAQRVADELSEVSRSLVGAEAFGVGGGGLVRASVDGTGRVLAVDIDPSLFDADDLPGLGAALAEAVNAARDSLTAARSEQVERVTAGMAEMLAVMQERTSRYR